MTLDAQIRAQLDRPANLNDCEDYADALQAVLCVEPGPSTLARFISDQKFFHAGQESYRREVRRAIAGALGITEETE